MERGELVTAPDHGIRLIGAFQRLLGEHIDDGIEPWVDRVEPRRGSFPRPLGSKRLAF